MKRQIIMSGLIGLLLISCNEDDKKKSNKDFREIDKKALQDTLNVTHKSGAFKGFGNSSDKKN
jgi:hypothetical protein